MSADLRQLQARWKKETGEDISPETAQEYAISILGLVDLAYRPGGL